MGFLGKFARGAMAWVKPCFPASRRRSWPFGTGRTSPVSPISPKHTRSLGKARLRKLDSTAATNAMSAPVSMMRTPPTALANTS